MTVLQANFIVSDCAEACAFYQAVFGANVRHLTAFPKGRNEARIEIAGMHLHLFESNAEMRIFPPGKQDRKVMWWQFICDNVDEVFAMALQEGAEPVEALRNLRDFGVRQGTVQDPFGYAWILTQNVRPMSEAQIGIAQTARQMIAPEAAPPPSPRARTTPVEQARSLQQEDGEPQESEE